MFSSPPGTQKRFEEALVRMIAESGSGFNLVASDSFKDMIATANPKLRVPCRMTLADKLVPETYAKLKAQLVACCNTKSYGAVEHVALLFDGCGSRDGVRDMLNFSAKLGDDTIIFVDSIDVTGKSHTGQFLADQILRVMRSLEEDGFGPVLALVSDHASSMEAAKRHILLENPTVVLSSCSAHTLELLVKDILKITEIKAVLRLAMKIVYVVKKSSYLRANLKGTSTLKGHAHAHALGLSSDVTVLCDAEQSRSSDLVYPRARENGFGQGAHYQQQ